MPLIGIAVFGGSASAAGRCCALVAM